MRICITGGAGYVGSRLVPELLKDINNSVIVYDSILFGDVLPIHSQLHVVEGDIRDTAKLAKYFKGVDVVLHLACISNDPSFELDAELSRTINLDAFEPMVKAAKTAGVKRFIYCSSSSVYGVSDAPNVTEDHPLVPITLYNKYKAECEPILFKYMDDGFTCVVLRPSTVCGYSPRQRLDLAVNILTNLAVNKRKITVFGGAQMRPNLHIEDMVRCYQVLIDAPSEKIQGQIFNVGARNYSIAELAVIVKDVVEQQSPGPPIEIETLPIADIRSYQVDSSKIAKVLGFIPQFTVEDAVKDLCHAFRKGLLPNSLEDDKYFNVKRMNKIMPDLYKGHKTTFNPNDVVFTSFLYHNSKVQLILL